MRQGNDKQGPIDDFSLVLGGPLYQLFLRSRLVQPPLALCIRRMVFISMLAWLPLLLFSLFERKAFGGVQVPFLYDIATHARFLVALTLMIAAELSVHYRVGRIVQQFVDRDIVVEEHRPTFDKIIESCMRLRNSVGIEILLVIVAFGIGPWIWRAFSALHVTTWYATITQSGPVLSSAGYWCAFISLPIFQFILLRWYFRVFIWYKFLWQVSRLPLQLNSLHPDKAGGLGFLALSVFAFSPFLIAHTVLLAGQIGNLILYTGTNIADYKLEIIGIMLYLMILMFLPLTFFMLHMLRTKRTGNYEYGVTASRYVNAFRQKWIGSSAKGSNDILGAADIQSLADLAGSFDVSAQMRLVPFGRGAILSLILLIAVPLLPLALLMMPIEHMINGVIKIIF